MNTFPDVSNNFKIIMKIKLTGCEAVQLSVLLALTIFQVV